MKEKNRKTTMKLSLKKISEFEDIAEFFEFFQTEQDCVDYLEKII